MTETGSDSIGAPLRPEPLWQEWGDNQPVGIK
jgi:hypothetical protein